MFLKLELRANDAQIIEFLEDLSSQMTSIIRILILKKKRRGLEIRGCLKKGMT